jgi:hypothetical protein
MGAVPLPLAKGAPPFGIGLYMKYMNSEIRPIYFFSGDLVMLYQKDRGKFGATVFRIGRPGGDYEVSYSI